MFHVIKDVDKYKDFLIYATDSYISNVKDHDHFEGTIGVNFKIYKDAFNSTVSCSHDKSKGLYVVQSKSESNSMFSEMVSEWKIIDKQEAFDCKNGEEDNIGDDSTQNDCDIDYTIRFEFVNSFYNSAAAYVMDFVGEGTYCQFVNRAKDIYKNEKEAFKDDKDDPMNSQTPQERSAFYKFEEVYNAKKSEFVQQIHIMNHLKHLVTEKLLSNDDYIKVLGLYEKDEEFSDRVHTIYSVYDTDEEVHENQQKILFFLKKDMREFE